jgi:AAA15 family ATPase/GTPase
MPFDTESRGTIRLVELAPLLYHLLHDGAGDAAFVDELDSSLHPVLLKGLVEEINRGPVDAARGQLIFTTHDVTLLDEEAKHGVLRRDQVYFTEKDASGVGRLYSLAEFKERQNLNPGRRYMQGRYGALPAIGSVSE